MLAKASLVGWLSAFGRLVGRTGNDGKATLGRAEQHEKSNEESKPDLQFTERFTIIICVYQTRKPQAVSWKQQHK